MLNLLSFFLINSQIAFALFFFQELLHFNSWFCFLVCLPFFKLFFLLLNVFSFFCPLFKVLDQNIFLLCKKLFLGLFLFFFSLLSFLLSLFSLFFQLFWLLLSCLFSFLTPIFLALLSVTVLLLLFCVQELVFVLKSVPSTLQTLISVLPSSYSTPNPAISSSPISINSAFSPLKSHFIPKNFYFSPHYYFSLKCPILASPAVFHGLFRPLGAFLRKFLQLLGWIKNFRVYRRKFWVLRPILASCTSVLRVVSTRKIVVPTRVLIKKNWAMMRRHPTVFLLWICENASCSRGRIGWEELAFSA